MFLRSHPFMSRRYGPSDLNLKLTPSDHLTEPLDRERISSADVEAANVSEAGRVASHAYQAGPLVNAVYASRELSMTMWISRLGGCWRRCV